MAHVFISYKHDDDVFVAELIAKIHEAGFTAWRDTERLRAGRDWRRAIDEAIRTAFALIVVTTPETKTSEYVTYEWAFAIGAGVEVLPVLLLPSSLHPRLEVLQYLDFTRHEQRPWGKLIKWLTEVESEYNSRATEALQSAPTYIQQAVNALNSFNRQESTAALEALAQMDHPVAVEALANAVQGHTRELRMDAAFKLAERTHGKDIRALPGLMEGLKHENWKKRVEALQALSRVADSSTVPEVIGMFSDPDSNVTSAAAIALADMGEVAIDDLINALKDDSWRLRRGAAEALGMMRDPRAISGLAFALADSQPVTRQIAAEALSQLGADAIPAIASAMSETEDDKLREVLAQKLIAFGESAVYELVQMLQQTDDRRMRRFAAGALGMTGSDKAVPALISALRDKDHTVADTAANSLSSIGTKEAIVATMQYRHSRPT